MLRYILFNFIIISFFTAHMTTRPPSHSSRTFMTITPIKTTTAHKTVQVSKSAIPSKSTANITTTKIQPTLRNFLSIAKWNTTTNAPAPVTPSATLWTASATSPTNTTVPTTTDTQSTVTSKTTTTTRMPTKSNTPTIASHYTKTLAKSIDQKITTLTTSTASTSTITTKVSGKMSYRLPTTTRVPSTMSTIMSSDKCGDTSGFVQCPKNCRYTDPITGCNKCTCGHT